MIDGLTFNEFHKIRHIKGPRLYTAGFGAPVGATVQWCIGAVQRFLKMWCTVHGACTSKLKMWCMVHGAKLHQLAPVCTSGWCNGATVQFYEI